MEFPITINNQDEYDNIVKNRLTREREKWEKESGIAEANERARTAEGAAYGRVLKRDARDVLKGMGVPENRHERIIKNAALPEKPDKDGEPDRKAIEDAFKTLHGEVPELFGEGVRVEETALDTGGSSAGGDQDAPLTRERIEKMRPEEINEPSMWTRVQAFLAGER